MTEGKSIAEGKFLGAATVAIVVHAVGDHSQVDILTAAARGLEQAFPGASAKAISVPTLPLQENDSTSTVAMEIESEGKRHIVLPIIWSHTRKRLSAITREHDSEWRLPVSPSDFIDLVWAMAARFFPTCFDIFCCVPKARGVARKAATFVIGIVFLILTLLLFVGAVGTVSLFAVLATGADNLLGVIGALAATWLIIFFATFAAKRLFSEGLDFVADVVTYVSRRGRRERIQLALGEVVETVARWAPDSRIIVVAHSLGTVLVRDTLLRHPEKLPAGRLVLMTMGSALPKMSSFFPRHVMDAERSLKEFVHSGSVGFWLNVWRDSDFIGKGLGCTPGSTFAETSIGPGGHADYWGDSRTWEVTALLLEAVGEGNPQNAVLRWRQRQEQARLAAEKELDDEQKLRTAHSNLIFARGERAMPIAFTQHARLGALSLIGTGCFVLFSDRLELLSLAMQIIFYLVWACTALLTFTLVLLRPLVTCIVEDRCKDATPQPWPPFLWRVWGLFVCQAMCVFALIFFAVYFIFPNI